MSLTTACIRGKMGDIEYFQTTMTAQGGIIIESSIREQG